MAYFGIGRCIERSIIDYLKDSFTTDWTSLDITVVKSFTDAYTKKLPVLSIEYDDIDTEGVEIGSTKINKKYYLNLNFFARNAGERIDIVDFVIDKLKDGCPLYQYEYESGGFDNITGSNIGRCNITIEDTTKIDTFENSDKMDKYRYLINISVIYYGT